MFVVTSASQPCARRARKSNRSLIADTMPEMQRGSSADGRSRTSSDRATRSAIGGGADFMEMVLPDRIELSTSPLPRECSTTELRQRAPAKQVANQGRKRAVPCHKGEGGA